MFQIEAAGLVIRIENRLGNVRELCREYITGEDRKPDITVSVTGEEVKREMEKSPELFFGEGYAESVLIYGKISNELPGFDGFVMHSSVVEVNGGAYAFAAESGTGKSTHTRYWKEVLGEKMTIINGDKPIYRFTGSTPGTVLPAGTACATGTDPGVLLAFGTPWCGKENWQTKTSAPLKALCLLERSERNEIFPINALEHLSELMRHFHLPGDGLVDMQKLMELIGRTVETVPVYRLKCRNDISAAKTATEYFGL